MSGGLAEVLAAKFGLNWRGMYGEPDGAEIASEIAAAVTDWLTERLASDEVREVVSSTLSSIEARGARYDMTGTIPRVDYLQADGIATAALTAVTAALRGES